MISNKLSNSWGRIGEDPRLGGFLEASWTMSDIIDVASGRQDILRQMESNPEIYPYLPPLELAEALEKQKRLPDGLWRPVGYYWNPLGKKGLPQDVVDWGRDGPNEMITLNALRVLNQAGRLN